MGLAPQRAPVSAGTEVKSEEGVSPPPASPPSHHTAHCSYCGVPERKPNAGAGTGGFITPPPAFESRCRRSQSRRSSCAECGRGFGQKPELVRHPGAQRERGYACGRCGRGFAEPAGLGAGHPCRPTPCPAAPGDGGGGPVAPRKERKELSLTEKVRVLEMLEGPKVSQSELAKRFGVSQPQICRIIKNKERILSEWHRNGDPERKRKRGEGRALEAALLRWVEGARPPPCPAPVPSSISKPTPRRALGRPDTDPSGAGWHAFGARHNLAFKKPPAEKGREQPTEHWASVVLPALLRSYLPSEIYVCETGVLLPTGSPEGESAGDWLTLLLCTNADGSESPLRAVGESPRPRCLQGNLGQMPWSYRAGSPGWTAPLFTEWLREFNEGWRQGKSVLLPAKHEAHPYLQLSNVRWSSSRHAAALDRGIADDLKGHYRRLLRWLPARGTGQPTLLDALHMLAQAWATWPGLIASCFRAAASARRRAEASALTLASGLLGQGGAGMHGGPADGDDGTIGRRGQPESRCRPCPSEREVWGSLATLRRYLECRATSPDLFQAFYELEDVVHMVSASAGRALIGDTPPKQ
ncbi:LOW QUALITY PROTEIN: tigger transposable element-derived protein 3-like [Alca torda]